MLAWKISSHFKVSFPKLKIPKAWLLAYPGVEPYISLLALGAAKILSPRIFWLPVLPYDALSFNTSKAEPFMKSIASKFQRPETDQKVPHLFVVLNLYDASLRKVPEKPKVVS